MYPMHESRESPTMRRHRRRSNWFAILAGFSTARDAAVSLSQEADRLESVYGEDAVAFVREQVKAADRRARKHLYRLHDELARRRRRNDFAGLMA
jgi:hypothetical protein